MTTKYANKHFYITICIHTPGISVWSADRIPIFDSVKTPIRRENAAGVDVEFPEIIRNSGRNIENWLVTFYSGMEISGVLYQRYIKTLNIVAIVKPGYTTRISRFSQCCCTHDLLSTFMEAAVLLIL